MGKREEPYIASLLRESCARFGEAWPERRRLANETGSWRSRRLVQIG
jgi:hypothetical protein